MNKIDIYNERKAKNVWLLFLLLGWSYGNFNQMGKQILFYITFGGFGLWSIYLLFKLSDKEKDFNRKVAIDAGFTNEELVKFGLE